MGPIRAAGVLLLPLLIMLGGHTGGSAAAPPGATYTAQLTGGEEVPPHATPASGQATFQVSADGQALTYTVTVNNLTNLISGHIHLAPKGQNGDVVLPVVPPASPGGGPKSGVIGQGTATADQLTGPLQGKTIADLVAQLDAGNAYVNVHTASGASPATQQPGDIPAGEIRGQIAPGAPAGAAPSAGPAATPGATPAAPSSMPGAVAAPAPAAVPRTGGGFATRRDPRPLALALLAILAAGGVAVRRTRRPL